MLKIKINEKLVYEVERKGNEQFLNGKEFIWDMIKIKDHHFHIIKNNRSFNAEVLSADYNNKSFSIRINGNNYIVEAKDKYDELLKQLGMENLSSAKVNEIKAPMPGLVLRILIQEKQELKKGDSVLVLEAMKMENVLKSPGDGIVRQIKVKPGDKVEKNEVLVLME